MNVSKSRADIQIYCVVHQGFKLAIYQPVLYELLLLQNAWLPSGLKDF